jgi:hypothetical protein
MIARNFFAGLLTVDIIQYFVVASEYGGTAITRHK